jgi:hypothetical protein
MSTELKITDTTIWAALGAVFGWALAVERRIFNRVTRRELKESLDEIKAHLSCQDKEAAEHRDRVSRQLHTIGIKVAVIQTRMNHPPTGDTGTFKEGGS